MLQSKPNASCHSCRFSKIMLGYFQVSRKDVVSSKSSCIAWDFDVTDSPATSRPRFPGSGGRPPATFPPISLAAKLPAAKFATLHASACSRPLPCCTFQHVFKALSQLPAPSGTCWLRSHLRTSTLFRNQRRGKIPAFPARKACIVVCCCSSCL